MASKRTVLFLCTGNSCRSQMAEALLRHLAGDRFTALSAGSHPAGFVHVLAVDALRHLHIRLGTLESKSWDVFRDTHVDAVITLCDSAATVECPVWPGSPIVAHWSLSDPTLHPGAADERVNFAIAVATRLRHKVQAMIDLDWTLPRDQLEQRLQILGEI